MANPWIPDTLNFILIIFSGAPLNPILYFIIGFTALPVLLFCWVIAFKGMVFSERYKLFFIIYIIVSIIFEIGFYYLLFTDIKQVGVHITPFQVEFGIFMIIYFLFLVVISLVVGLIFFIRSFRIDNSDIKLRGKFIFIAFLTFCTAVVIDSILGAIDPLWIIFNRILLLISGILFYLGFILPESIKKLFRT